MYFFKVVGEQYGKEGSTEPELCALRSKHPSTWASQLQLPALSGSLHWRPSCHSTLGSHLQLSSFLCGKLALGLKSYVHNSPGALEASSHKPLRWRHLYQIPHISGTGSGGDGVLDPTSNSEMTWLLQNPLLPWNSPCSSFCIHSLWSFSPPLSPPPHPLPPCFHLNSYHCHLHLGR